MYDTVRRKWAQHVTEVVARTGESSNSAQPDDTSLSLHSDSEVPLKGWVLKSQKTASKTSETVKVFLIAKFNKGLVSGQKANPTDASKEMQNAKDLKGLLLFSPEKWKTARQINSYFSRLSAVQKSNQAQAITVGDEGCLDNENLRTWEDHSNLKVVELKGICANFALTSTGNPPKKSTYIDSIEELVESCSCSTL